MNLTSKQINWPGNSAGRSAEYVALSRSNERNLGEMKIELMFKFFQIILHYTQKQQAKRAIQGTTKNNKQP